MKERVPTGLVAAGVMLTGAGMAAGLIIGLVALDRLLFPENPGMIAAVVLVVVPFVGVLVWLLQAAWSDLRDELDKRSKETP